MQFIYPALAWGFALLMIPVLVHLINMMRHRRVKWAAMDFLLQSHKKLKHWILLRQLLLLASRLAVVALLVAMLAGLITTEHWTNLFGDRIVHHYVVIDDSLSMRERLAGSTAMEKGVIATQRILEESREQDRPQRVSLIFFSDFLRSPESLQTEAIASRRDVDSSSLTRLHERLEGLTATELAISPKLIFERLAEMLESGQDTEAAEVHLVSDFRLIDWGNDAEIRPGLERISALAENLHLIDCARTQQQNLAITEVTIGSGTLAAGVPTMVKITVQNFGATAATNVPANVDLMIADDSTDISLAGKSLSDSIEQPPLNFDEIPPGQQVTRQTQIVFPRSGEHALRVRLPDDPLELDHRRYVVAKVDDSVPVLIVDGDARQFSAYFLQTIFNPGSSITTGINPEVTTNSFLATANLERLKNFACIYLIDPVQVDDRIAVMLKEYVEQGGGLAIFLGENARPEAIAKLEEAGITPLPLDRPRELPPDPRSTTTPDFQPGDNPVFRVFLGETNPFLRRMSVSQYYAAHPTWKAEDAPGVEVLGSLRNGDPLVVERRLGEGRVVAVLTSLTPTWNSWATNPSFIVAMLELRAYLSPNRARDNELTVGQPLEFSLSADEYRPDVQFYTPGPNRMPTTRGDLQKLNADGEDDDLRVALTGFDEITGTSRSGQSGVYEAWLTRSDGTNSVRRFAANVDSREGASAIVSDADLRRLYPSVPFLYHAAETMEYGGLNQDTTHWQGALLALLIVCLLAEQFLGYLTSFHPPLRGGIVG
ncbi:MAG: BatA domain-containing protein [Pirellulaceae bacterium]